MRMSYRLQTLTPLLQVVDIGRTLDWYAGMLGFRCVSREGGWARVERDGVALMFMTNDHLGAPHATATQYIHVDDVDALWGTIRDRITAEWGPEDMPYGLREFAIRDPDGYLLSFGQVIAGSRAKAAKEGNNAL
jgi:uncharacterized glyoxalase superfamily protein PhnB